MFQGFKNLFSNSGTLMLAAGSMLGGALASGVAALDASQMLDQFVSSGFNWKVVAAAGITAFVHGAVAYVTRLRGTTTVEVSGKPTLAPLVDSRAKVTSDTNSTIVAKKV